MVQRASKGKMLSLEPQSPALAPSVATRPSVGGKQLPTNGHQVPDDVQDEDEEEDEDDGINALFGYTQESPPDARPSVGGKTLPTNGYQVPVQDDGDVDLEGLFEFDQFTPENLASTGAAGLKKLLTHGHEDPDDVPDHGANYDALFEDEEARAPKNRQVVQGHDEGSFEEQPPLEMEFPMTNALKEHTPDDDEPNSGDDVGDEDISDEDEANQESFAIENSLVGITSNGTDYQGEAEAQKPKQPAEPEEKAYVRFSNMKTNMKKSNGHKRAQTNGQAGDDVDRPGKRAKVVSYAEALTSSSPLPSPMKKADPMSMQQPYEDTKSTAPQGYSDDTSHSSSSDDKPHPFQAHIADEVKDLYDSMVGRGFKTLPALEKDGEALPWNSKYLMHLYIYSASRNQAGVEICDLIADTWIRAFQQRDRGKDEVIWRENTHHPDRKKMHVPSNGLPPAPDWQEAIAMPKMSSRVTDFNVKLLNQLYYHTEKDNGARKLWADAIALCGSSAEKWVLQNRENGEEFHPDFLFDIMCTALRMTRRKLTLKIEELGQDAWCKRYHCHDDAPGECYRAGLNIERLQKETERAQAAADDALVEENEVRHVHFEQGTSQCRVIEAYSSSEGDCSDSEEE